MNEASAQESDPKRRRYSRKSVQVRRRELIDAAIRCLGRGGISAFTVDQICREAGVSKGLLNHHFEGKDELLLCAYESMTSYLRPGTAHSGDAGADMIQAVIDLSFNRTTFDRSQLRAWLAIWGEIAAHPQLQEMHRKRYRELRRGLTSAIGSIAARRRRSINARGLARTLIATIDGLWLECCLDPRALPLRAAREDCYRLIESELGSIR